MPQLRRDPVIDRWVIIATERSARPDDFHTEQAETQAQFCPFCEGNEDKTPPEIMSFRSPGTRPNTPGWRTSLLRLTWTAR